MGPAGVTRIGGEGSGVLGRGGIDRVLQVAPGHEPLLTASEAAACKQGSGEDGSSGRRKACLNPNAFASLENA